VSVHALAEQDSMPLLALDIKFFTNYQGLKR
jgi:hypothetical protein